jgi:hydroxycarboxylate dehydrogenase B
MEMAIEKTKGLGVSILAIRDCGHMGRIGAYGEQCAAAGLVSLHFANVSGHAPFVAPFGGREARLSTNPFCFAVPTGVGAAPVILDCATSKLAWGKLKVAHNKGRKAPPGAMLDEAGKPTRDPGLMVPVARGAMIAFGEHKGSGLGLICELLGGALAGGATIHPKNRRDLATINSMLSIVIDPTRLGDAQEIGAEIDGLIDYVRSALPIDADVPVRIAGEPERRMRAERQARGIPLDPGTWAELAQSAAGLHMDINELIK